MDKKILTTIEKFKMCPLGSSVVIGVSGGADSISLLHYFFKNSKNNNWDIHVVHINHNLRGEDSKNDMEFVKNICTKYNIKCTVFAIDILKESKKRKLGTEETGRLIRYENFQNIAKDMGEKTVIAVAHNEDDQAETVLMKLCRGANLKGLSGIKPINGNIIRPLLFVSREEIENYCKDNELEFVTDKTNNETVYTRNKMRIEIIPKLEKIYPKTKKHIAKTGFYIAEENQFLEEMMLKYFDDVVVNNNDFEITLNLEKIKNIPIVMVRRIFVKILNDLGLNKNFSAIHIENIVDLMNDKKMKEICLPNNIFVKTSYKTLNFNKGKIKIKDFDYNLILDSKIYIEEIDIYIDVFLENYNHELKNEKNYIDDYTKAFDYDKIKEVLSFDEINSICCRNRKIGDKIPVGSGSKTLKTYFIDEKIPKEYRDSIPLIAFENIIFWVVGYKVSSEYLADENTKKSLIIKIMEG